MRRRIVTGLDVQEEAVRLDPGAPLDDEGFLAVCVLLSSAVVGACADRVARHLGEPRGPVRAIGRRLRRNGVWRGGRVCSDWSGGGLWVDAGIGIGWFERVKES